MRYHHLRNLVVAAVALVAAACGETTPYEPLPTVASVTVAPDTATLVIGAARPLAVQVRKSDGSPVLGYPVAWASENEAVARVSANGLLTAVGEGSTRVTATAGGQAGRATITVVQAPLASLEILGDSVRVLERGGSAELIAIGRDAAGNALNGVIPTWTSSDPDRVWVSNTGGVVAMRGGSVTVTATFQDRTAAVRVRVPAIRWIDALPKDGTIEIGGSLQARAEVHTENGIRAIPVQWASENPEIAGIDASGRITPVRAGIAIIRASAEGVDGRVLVLVNGERQPLRAVSADAQALPVALHETFWTDEQGNLQRGRLVLAQAQLSLTSGGRYTQRSWVHYTQDGVVRAVRTIEDAGEVRYDFMNGDLILVSDRIAGRESRGAFEYANGYPTGGITLTHRIGHDGAAVTVLYRQ